MSRVLIHRASPEDLGANPGFRALLTSASDARGEALDALIAELNDLSLLVVRDAGSEPVGLALYRRLDDVAVELEYLAVHKGHRNTGMATALVHRIRDDALAMVVARTDEDAIGFYRATGFQVSDSAPDARWPSRRRYLCVLPHLPLLMAPQPEDASAQWINGPPVPEPIEVVDASPQWRQDYVALAERIREALGDRALAIEHLGSTSVRGLDAKPVIDVVLTVQNPDCEEVYVPLLEAAGFVFRLREQGWYRHRLLVPGPASGQPAANIHVFAPGSPETSRMLAFRNWLRTHEADREAYGRIKRAAVAQVNGSGGGAGLVMDYNVAKEPCIRKLYERILQHNPVAGPAH